MVLTCLHLHHLPDQHDRHSDRPGWNWSRFFPASMVNPNPRCFAGLPEMQAMLPSGNVTLWWFNGILMAMSMDLWWFNGILMAISMDLWWFNGILMAISMDLWWFNGILMAISMDLWWFNGILMAMSMDLWWFNGIFNGDVNGFMVI